MQRVTFRVLDGADRGRVYADLEPPITIGREEGNTVQLNDERVSRFHAKIQLDHDNVVLTDLDSTNGTRVNGEDIQLRNLRFGDLLQVGRTVMVYGTRDEIARRLREVTGGGREGGKKKKKLFGPEIPPDSSDIPWRDKEGVQEMFFSLDPPELPERLSPGQAAQLSEVMEYFLITLRHVIESVREEPKGERVTLELPQWQSLIDMQARVAEYLRQIGDPNTGGS